MVEPLKPGEARKLIHHILNDGYVTYSRPHAIERMEERQMDTSDFASIFFAVGKSGKASTRTEVGGTELRHQRWRLSSLSLAKMNS
ncbi:MAG: hypothetical protein U1D97_00670 [Desulfuromonadales bacterium]|nr:hypothetical protein [Desulfuromonadales bacterium]